LGNTCRKKIFWKGKKLLAAIKMLQDDGNNKGREKYLYWRGI
jgi:hypothetical protein